MKFWELTLIMIMFNAFGFALSSSGFFSRLGFTESLPYISTAEEDVNNAEEVAREFADTGVTSLDAVSMLFSIVSESSVKIIKFFDTIKGYIFWPATLLSYFNVPWQIGSAVTVVFNMVQVVGIVQIITGKSFRGMD
jgi:hypothetical protein